MTAKEHINQIQYRWNSANADSALDMANAINDIIHSIFEDAARIGYELLQNADDAGFASINGVDVKYYLLDRHLIIQHNGGHFNADNVEALCKYGSSSKAKEDSDKIGYKGIGFKSVFNIADKVWILSKDYTFRFDKAYWKDKPMPWQIVPIYTEGSDIPPEISTFVETEKVTFILELKAELLESQKLNTLRNSIAVVLSNEQNLLFLRHVTNFEILYKHAKSGDIISYRKIEKIKDKHVVTLQKYAEKPRENAFSRWHVSTFPITIPREVSETLVNLNRTQCPDKLKNAESIDLSFAAKLKDDNTVELLGRPFIFSYLPTLKRYEFPFIVNSNFLLDSERTQLLPVKWNEFLFEKIGYFQFKWFEEMAQDERFKFEFVGLLVKYAESNRLEFNQKINEGVIAAQSEIAFVPVLNSHELKKAPDTIIDNTGISYEIAENKLVQKEFDAPYEIADPKIKLINRLVEVGANEFNHKKLSAAIKKGNRFKNPIDNTKLIDYFYNHINAISNQTEKNEWMKVLHETTFLLDNDNNLQEPSALYFPKDKPELPFEIPMTFLNETIYSNRIKEDKKLEDWLCQLKVAFPKPIEIIRNGLFPLIDKKEINNQNTIAITQYLFEHKDKLEKYDREKLSFLPLLTKGNSMYEATFCYLADECQPNLAVEQYIKDDIFVSLRYLVNSTDLGAWKAFWLSLNVRQDMDLELHEQWYDFNVLKLNTTYIDYTKFLKLLLPTHNKRGETTLFSLLIPRYIEYANSYPFAVQYWQLLLNKRWNELIKKCDKAKFKHTSGTVSIPSYFEFLIKTNAYFPATNGNCYKTEDVYSNALQDIVKDWKPISYFELTSSKEKLLGIKSLLSLDDCIAILESIAKGKDELDKERITALYKYMLNHFDEEAIKNGLESAANLPLLAINNSFQAITTLKYFNLPKFVNKADSSDFVFLDLDKNDALSFCKLFGIKVFNEDILEFESIPYVTDNQLFNSEWDLKLPYIAVVSSSINGCDYETEFTRLKEKTEKTDFKASEKLSLILKNGEELIYEKEVFAWQKDNDVYYAYNWQDKRVIFEFSEVLCHYFDIKDTERELELILNLKQNDVYNWLEKQGFEVSVIISETTSTKVDSQTSVKVPVMDIPKVVVIETTTKPVYFSTTNNDKKPVSNGITKGDALDFGLWGEKYVHDQKIIEDYYERHNIEIISVIWQNEDKSGNPHEDESRTPYDFEVILNNGLKHYWEIKTTPSGKKAEFPISSNEIKFALEKSEVYFIIRVFNAGKEDEVKYSIWSNPIELIKNGKIKISDVKMEIID